MPKRYDAVIIGSGPGGYVSAIRLRRLERSVCVIDMSDDHLGGVCLNEGCIPVKSIIYSSRLFSAVKKAGDYGIEADAESPDMKKIAASSRDAASQLRSGLKGLFKKYGIEFVAGRARIASKNKVSVELKDGGQEDIEADDIIIAAGSSPKIPSNIRLDGEKVITSREAIRLEYMPETMLVVGAGAIGVEFASIFALLGTKVTLIEALPAILPFEDEDVSKTLLRTFKKRGIEVLVNTSVESLDKKTGFERILVAAGRKPNTGDIGLEKAGVKLKDGFILTDSRMRTSVDNIYAVGDVVNTPMYAHVAYEEGRMAADDIAGVKRKPIDYGNVPNAVFSDPQVASVGLTEAKARKVVKEPAVSRHFFKANGMAVAARRDEGFIKIIADKKTRAIMGAHIIGGDATEMIHEFVVAKSAGLTADDIAGAVHAHPTFSELAADAARMLFDRPIHS